MIRLIVTSGRGPAECRLAVAGLVRILLAEAEGSGLDAEIVHGKSPDKHGPSSVAVLLHGEGEQEFARRWLGSLLWISPSPLRPHHRRKNWFVGIFELKPASKPEPLSLRDVKFDTMRAGGAGGQHQNKTESAVRAVHIPSGTTVVVRSERSQHRNKAQAVERLAEVLATRHELLLLADKKRSQEVHDLLERGKPGRRFYGPEFRRMD